MDPVDFIERVEELARSQRVPLDQVPFTLSESFRDNALAWWRNRRHEWLGWLSFKQSFLKFFLPVNFWDDLEDSIRRRQQREDEPFKDFALALETLMRHTQYTPLQKVERIYKNSLPALRLLVKRREFESLEELTDLILHIEATRGPLGPTSPLTTKEVTTNLQPKRDNGSKGIPSRPSATHGNPAPTSPRETNERTTSSATPEYIQNPKDACRKCGRQGHSVPQCKNPARYFCWTCGKVGILTKNCCQNNNTRLNIVHSGTAKPSTDLTRFQLSAPHFDGRSIMCQVTMGLEAYRAIVDTGSWQSYIDEEVVAKIPLSSYVRRACRYSVVLATGIKENVNSSLDLSFQYQDKTISNNMLIKMG